MNTRLYFLSLLAAVNVMVSANAADKDVEFFEAKVRPVLVEHCYKCHSAETKELKGGLRLDLKTGWQAGGDSGEPAIVPGKPDESPLLRAMRHADGVEAMPPNQSKLPEQVIADLTTWIKNGAVDPRAGKLTAKPRLAHWETIYQQRLQWWSLQPIKSVAVPAASAVRWPRNEVDHFILRDLQAQRLQPAREAERRTLARRLSFVLTGLPPNAEVVNRFIADDSPAAYDNFVQALMASPHFGEHWARHWMDVIHYADTHGYEWDTPAKNAWLYRDYLIRAFNADIPFDRLILEQLAGDLIEPRIDAKTQVNEALIAPMAFRLGERRHGDNAQSEGVTQETIANIIDTVSKGFLGTTVACARCHDHKLDAIGQRDYYSLAGVFMSTRWNARTIDAHDPNTAVIAELTELKRQIRAELVKVWVADREKLLTKLMAIPANEKAAATFPQSLTEFWQREELKPLSQDEFAQERERRIAANRANLKLLADFTTKDTTPGWQWDGFGMQHGLARDGDIVVAGEGDAALLQVLPAGRWSHLWSMRLAGALRSPQFPPDSATTLSLGFAGGHHVAQSLIVDQAFHCERMKFLNQPKFGWLTVTAGNFDSLEGSIDRGRRRVYLELATKSLNNYFPPRTGYGGLSEKDASDQRSWFGVTKVFEHPPGKAPVDELTRFAAIYEGATTDDVVTRRQRFVQLLQSTVERWSRDECSSEDALLLDEAVRGKLLSNELAASAELAKLVAAYRAAEKRLQSDQTIGSVSEWNEASNERIGIRGSYTDFGDEVPRGNIRFLSQLAAAPSTTDNSSGRLQLARVIANEQNPLTARVYVNRVWQHLFGFGLVRTPDDFGHLGEQPTHPELLDYLADRFMREGWSTKKLITLLVGSATFRQSSQVDKQVLTIDPENRLWHHWPARRLEAEGIRDSILATAGRLDDTLFGPPIEPHRTAEDPMKRLMKGPLDGQGRRSIYLKMTLMEPPRFLALFNQPIPLLTVGRRDVTNVPDQALALLNDPFVIAMAKHWSEQIVKDGSTTPEQRAEKMFAAALARPPTDAEVERLVRLARRSGELRQVNSDSLLTSPDIWQDVGHAIFNLKEFIYVQ
jgi:hypothetical protein